MSERDNQQERAREEIDLANGPVSRGARNSTAPDSISPAQPDSAATPDASGQPAYNKMIHTQGSETARGTGMATDQRITSPAGGTLPTGNGTDTPRGGINTSNSTVGAGGSSAGTVIGGGMPRDRGSADNVDLNQTTNTAQETDQAARSDAQSETKAHPGI